MHLLKASAKQSSGVKKRKKVPLLGSFKEFTDSKKKPVPAMPQQQPPLPTQQIADQPMLAPQPQVPPAQKEDMKKRK